MTKTFVDSLESEIIILANDASDWLITAVRWMLMRII